MKNRILINFKIIYCCIQNEESSAQAKTRTYETVIVDAELFV